MKNTTLLIILLFTFNFVFSQNDLFKKDIIVFKNCDQTIKNNDCFKKRTLSFISKKIDKKIEEKLIKKSKSDTIEVYSKLFFDKSGNIILSKSDLKTNSDYVPKNFISILKKFPQIIPRVDIIGNPGESYSNETFAFKIEEKKLIPIDNYEPQVKKFIRMDSNPIFPYCSGLVSINDRSNCINKIIKKEIFKKFNTNLINKLALSSGVKTIAVHFRINKLGEIDNIIARSSRIELEEEVLRIMKSIRKAEQPAMKNGEPIDAYFLVPIKLRVD